jgi:hypothetical protein
MVYVIFAISDVPKLPFISDIPKFHDECSVQLVRTIITAGDLSKSSCASVDVNVTGQHFLWQMKKRAFNSLQYREKDN